MMRAKLLFIFHFILVTLLFFSTGSYRNWPYKIESDGKYYYQYLISLWYDGDIDFTNNYAWPTPSFMRIEIDHYSFRNIVSPQTGRPTNLFTIGPAILWSPFFVVAYGAAYWLNRFGLTSITMDGWSLYFQYVVMYAAVIYATITIILIFRLLRIYFDKFSSVMAVVLLFWATNWVYYSLFEVSMSHVYDLFTMVLFVWVYLKALDNQKIGAYLLAGFLAGLHVLVRTQNILTIAILVGYYTVWFSIKASPEKTNPVSSGMKTPTQEANNFRGETRFLTWRGHLAFAVMFLLSSAPLLLSNAYLYGSMFAIPQGGDFFNPLQPEFYGVLFSGRNGLFSHHPVLVLGALGILLALINYRTEKESLYRVVMPLVLIFIVQLYVNSTVGDWWAGHAFGQRRLISSFLLFAFGFAYLQKYWYKFVPQGKRYVLITATLFILMNFYLIYIHQFLWGYDDSHDILKWMFHDGPILIYLKHFQYLGGL